MVKANNITTIFSLRQRIGAHIVGFWTSSRVGPPVSGWGHSTVTRHMERNSIMSVLAVLTLDGRDPKARTGGEKASSSRLLSPYCARKFTWTDIDGR